MASLTGRRRITRRQRLSATAIVRTGRNFQQAQGHHHAR
jgi:hypothetical protein